MVLYVKILLALLILNILSIAGVALWVILQIRKVSAEQTCVNFVFFIRDRKKLMRKLNTYLKLGLLPPVVFVLGVLLAMLNLPALALWLCVPTMVILLGLVFLGAFPLVRSAKNLGFLWDD